MTTYTIDELNKINSLAEVAGKNRTGIVRSVRYKKVRVEDGNRYPVAIVASYSGAQPTIINDAAKIDQFLHRGC
jgi:L-asparaginase/Glu-tRNA(Gln) amidotransferase subunit D